MHGVMRKATHRNAIHIGQTPVTETAVDPDNLFNVPMDWDPLSLGGASADFIPIDDTPDAAFKKEAPPQSAVGVIGERITSPAHAEDTSAAISSSQTAVESVLVDEQPAAQQLEDTAVQDKHEGMAAAQKHGFGTAASPGGLKVDSDLRDLFLVSSASALEESTRQFPAVALGRQAMKDDKKKVEPAVEKLGPKKGKKRKRKK